MSFILDSQRNIYGILCDTSDDVLKALSAIRNEGQEKFFKSLKDAIDTGDLDLICGHIDWGRAKFGDSCMNSSQRNEVFSFYREFMDEHSISSDERASKFISEAFDKFV